MPRHHLVMWYAAGGGALLGAALTWAAMRPARMLSAARVRAKSWRCRHRAARGEAAPGPDTRPGGSEAFRDYRDSVLARLEQEERDFRRYLDRLQAARDREALEAFRSRGQSEGREA